jgi:4-hydroxybenzoate polyprenyltransferase
MGFVQVLELPLARGKARAAIVALRPRQWTKNALLFAGIVFAARIGDASRWFEALGAFAAYCAASSGAYVLNDLRDVESDRLHPVKRLRPIARGELSERAAVSLALGLVTGAVAVSALLGVWSLVLLAGFLAVQAAYSLGLKHIVLLDVAVIAGLFAIRAVAGAVAVRVPSSPWLVGCTVLLALFLALAKRRAELSLVAAAVTPGRRVLGGYSAELLERLLVALGVTTVLVYAAYTLGGAGSRWLALTIPLVVAGIGRYVQLVRRGAGEEPEEVLLRDLPLLGTIVTWAVACATILLVT